jgi:quercetin dioxygenase-like cupin family protein
MSTEERVLGPVGTEVVFENDRVRIWQLRLAPGERSAIHEHELDNVLIQISGGRIAAEPEADSAGEYNEYIEADVNPGDVVFIGKGGIETAVNKGTTPYLEIIVELKD